MSRGNIYEVEFNGQTYEIETPANMTIEDALKEFENSIPQLQLQGELSQQAREMPRTEQAAAGLGKFMTDRARGLGQLATLGAEYSGAAQILNAAGISGPVDAARNVRQSLEQQQAQANELDAGLMSTGGAQLGYLGGAVGELVAPSRLAAGTRAAPALNPVTIRGAAAQGAALGAAQPTTGQPGERLQNTLAGAAFGGGAQAGMQGILRGARGVVRGFGDDAARQAAQRLESYEGAGIQPTAGQVTGRDALQAVEGRLAQFPGGAGVFRRVTDEQNAAAGSRVESIIQRTAPRGAGEAQAGRAIERGILGPEGFRASSARVADKLYGQADAFLPPETSVQLTNTMRALDEIATPPVGGERTYSALANNQIATLRQNIAEDIAANAQAGVNGMPYGSVKAIRSRIGALLDDAVLNPDIDTRQLSRVYGAFSDDMLAAASRQGPEAERAVRRANNYYRAVIDRTERLKRIIERNGGPEAVFTAATSGQRNGATTINTVMRSLPTEERNVVAASIVERMARPNAGQVAQFDLGTFLTNWNRMHPRARQAMFAHLPAETRRQLDNISQAAEASRAGARRFANPPGTAPALLAGGGVLTAGTLAGIGQYDLAASVLGTMVAARGSAALMTNPRFVRFLSTSGRIPPGQMAPAIRALANQAAQAKDEELAEFSRAALDQLQNQPQE